jgi:hypothetical protein
MDFMKNYCLNLMGFCKIHKIMPDKIDMPIMEHKLIIKHLSIYFKKKLKLKNNLTIYLF